MSSARTKFGVSLSSKQCRAFGIDDIKCIKWAIKELGIRHFRLMSYWDEIEPTPGSLSWNTLDYQVDTLTSLGATWSLCLGVRQPRWPENHWPEWAWHLDPSVRTQPLLSHIRATVARYSSSSTLESYQLENEALLSSFGTRADIDRARLRSEFALVRQLDNTRPIDMSTSNAWGIPLRRPLGDRVGFSLYRVQHHKGRYRSSRFAPWMYRARAEAIKLLHKRESFIHELQLEPWGPRAIWEMSKDEQYTSMNPKFVTDQLAFAHATDLAPIDMWGVEWWYWLTHVAGDDEIASLIANRCGARV